MNKSRHAGRKLNPISNALFACKNLNRARIKGLFCETLKWVKTIYSFSVIQLFFCGN